MCHQRRLYGLHSRQKERGSAPGAVFGETGTPAAVLTADFLAGSDDLMTDTRKKKNDSVGLDWNSCSEVLRDAAPLPLDQIDDKLWNVRTGDIRFLTRGVAAEHFSHDKRDLDDKTMLITKVF